MQTENIEKFEKYLKKSICYDLTVNLFTFYGWKHSKMTDDIEPQDLMIFVFRNISTWLPRMRLNTYEKYPRNNQPMMKFLSEPWKPDLMLDTQQWKNVFEMRTEKYKSWLDYSINHPKNAVWVNYEQLVEDSSSFFGHLINKYGVPCKEEFRKSDCYSKHGGCWTQKKTVMENGKRKVVQTGQKQFSEKDYPWKDSEWQTVLNNIDKELEEKIGYVFS